MNNIIIGNGIDIQFGGLEYANKSIIERALLKLKTNDFSEEVYTKEIETSLKELLSLLNIFTTNYDKNIELTTNNKVLYLHGGFHILDSVYDPESYRNRLSDRPVDKAPAIKGFEHTFSTALTGSSGAFKQFSANQAELANSAINKFVKGMKENPDIKGQIEEWKNSGNEIVQNFYEAIHLKIKEPNLEFSLDYALNNLKEIEGKLTFIGLSPNNDSHIFKIIKENPKIHTIEFYYFDKKEINIINSFFDNKKIITEKVLTFWNKKRMHNQNC